ncbi:hypothetical protein [Mangrovicoccus ximenensis]|uniref:hypothetical protein n=1 Tax=Mangrovicoccus ximenensis TaxID=1911570 RepID=UPI000D352616|nr:hypothetical protein [Mangrovicoccus ximenensis]
MLTREDLEAFIDDADTDFMSPRQAETVSVPAARRRTAFVTQLAQAQMAMMQSWQRSMLPHRF